MSVNVLVRNILLIVTFVMSVNTGAADGIVQVKLHQHTFSIPLQNIVLGERVLSLSDYLDRVDESSGEAKFLFNGQMLKEAIDAYQVDSTNPSADDVLGTIIVPLPEHLENYIRPNSTIRDMWQGKDLYRNRVVELAEVSGWYKVYPNSTMRNHVVLLNRFPDSAEPMPGRRQDFFIGTCKDSIKSTCRTDVLVGDIVIDFQISAYNQHLLNEIREFVRKQVLEWKHEGVPN